MTSMILACLPTLCYILNGRISQKILNIYNNFTPHTTSSRMFGNYRIYSDSVKSVENPHSDYDLPLWEDSPESVIKQIRPYGPDPPDEIFRKPSRPLGFWGRNKAPDMSFIGMDRGAVVRNMKKKYKCIIYRNVRRTYKRYVKDATSLEEILYWKYKLASLPRDSSPSRFRRRCFVTGRSRGVVGIFGMCRHKAREYMSRGMIPGVVRASCLWMKKLNTKVNTNNPVFHFNSRYIGKGYDYDSLINLRIQIIHDL